MAAIVGDVTGLHLVKKIKGFPLKVKLFQNTAIYQKLWGGVQSTPPPPLPCTTVVCYISLYTQLNTFIYSKPELSIKNLKIWIPSDAAKSLFKPFPCTQLATKAQSFPRKSSNTASPIIARHAWDFTWNGGWGSNSQPLTHGDQIFLPLEDSDNQIPSFPGRQGDKCPGYTRGMLKLRRFDRYIRAWVPYDYTVEPLLSGTVLSGHNLLSDQFLKSRKLLPFITSAEREVKVSRRSGMY